MKTRLPVFAAAVFGVSALMPAGAHAEGLPERGGTSAFSYEREGPDSGFYLVSRPGESGAPPVAVSSNFLQLVLAGGPVDDASSFKLLSQYPEIMAGIYLEKMEANYPDNRLVFDAPFEPCHGEGFDIEQDPLAPPYVIVSLQLPSGELQEFSLNRDVVDALLLDNRVDKAMLFSALQAFPYRLPERARAVFEELTAEDIFVMAEEDIEGVKRQEFVKAKQWYQRREEEEEEEEEEAAARGPVVQPTRIEDAAVHDEQPGPADELQTRRPVSRPAKVPSTNIVPGIRAPRGKPLGLVPSPRMRRRTFLLPLGIASAVLAPLLTHNPVLASRRADLTRDRC